VCDISVSKNPIYIKSYVNQNLHYMSNIQGFKVAYVVFEDNMGLQRALKMEENMNAIILCTEETPITCGLQSKFKSV
jgi:hypothetical protein